jgi:hypothetical protein
MRTRISAFEAGPGPNPLLDGGAPISDAASLSSRGRLCAPRTSGRARRSSPSALVDRPLCVISFSAPARER